MSRKRLQPTSFILHHETYNERFLALSDEEKGRLFTAVFEYSINGKVVEQNTGSATMILGHIIARMDEDRSRWHSVCDIRSDAAKEREDKKRAQRAQRAQVCTGCTKGTNRTDNDDDNDEEQYKYSSSNIKDDDVDFKKFEAAWRNLSWRNAHKEYHLTEVKITPPRIMLIKERLADCMNLCNGDLDKAKSMVFRVIKNAGDISCNNWLASEDGKKHANFDKIFGDSNFFFKVYDGNFLKR